MENTVTLPDSLPTIRCGTDGAFLPLPGELDHILSNSPPDVADLSPLAPCQETPGNGTSACAHRQECYQALGNWYVRRGQYQRPDVTGQDRLKIAQRFCAPERPWGEVSDMAREYGLSRPTIYEIAGRAVSLFEPRLPGPVPCLKGLLPCGGSLTPPKVETNAFSWEEERRIRNRLILTSVFPGGVTMRPLEEVLDAAPLVGCSDTTIWRTINQNGAKARQILEQVDYADIALPLVSVAIDETYFDGRPILFVVEPMSLTVCGFHVPSDKDRSSLTWGPLLLVLQEDQNLDIFGGVGDAALPYPGTIKNLVKQAGRFQEDVFHQEWDLGKLQRKLENCAYRAFAAEYEALGQWVEEDTLENEEKLQQAQAASLHLAQLHDDFAAYRSWVTDAFEIVDLRSGEIRTREINAWLLDQAIAEMAQLEHPEVVKMSARLERHKPYLLTYLDWLETQLAPLRAELHAYLDDPQLEKVLLQAVARRWRWQHEVDSMQNRAFRSPLKHAEQELALWIEADDFLMEWCQQVHSYLEWVQRASSAVENVNSIFKPLVERKKHFSNDDTTLNFVALFVLWHNLRVFKEGKRRGHSPFDILGIDLGQKDWRTLLGYPPVH